jgi:hypothetical protein
VARFYRAELHPALALVPIIPFLPHRSHHPLDAGPAGEDHHDPLTVLLALLLRVGRKSQIIA